MKKILIIKHGAFGDIIKAIPTISAIFNYYKAAEISLLTTQKFVKVHQQFFDYNNIIIDMRSKNPYQTYRIIKTILGHRFDLVIDLQNAHRTNRYFYLLKYLWGAQFLWSGTAYGCNHYISCEQKRTTHYNDRFTQQLGRLGIRPIHYQPPVNLDLDLLKTLPKPYVVMIPGCSPTSPEKKWPMNNFLKLAGLLTECNISTVFIGGPDEADLNDIISRRCPTAVNLINKLGLLDIITVASQANLIVGNDTGPLYLAQLSGQPTCVLWSGHSNPKYHKPVGSNVTILQGNPIHDIDPSHVINAVIKYII